MNKLPLKLKKRLLSRNDDDSFRKLLPFPEGVDFFSNDYLGFSRSVKIASFANKLLEDSVMLNGSTGSRLLSGNHQLFNRLEKNLAQLHNAPSALVFNSGYDANIGFFSCVPQKGDIIFYDEYSHASIRDGIKLSNAKSFKFRHNDLIELEAKLNRISASESEAEIYIVTESVFSMDGDQPDLGEMMKIAKKHQAKVVIDEAHATGVLGAKGYGLVQDLNLEASVFARIITFGKALGCHGAAILGSEELKEYMVNFSRSFIYTTALSPHAVATIIAAYKELKEDGKHFEILQENIQCFKNEICRNGLQKIFIPSHSAIHSCVVPGNGKVKKIAQELLEQGFAVKPILSPTVPQGKERLRFCLHSYNNEKEISEVLSFLKNLLDEVEI